MLVFRNARTRVPTRAALVDIAHLLEAAPNAADTASNILVDALVRAGELFGFAEGTVRVALSRMVATGELQAVGTGRYRLAGHLLERQARQDESRRAPSRRWNGDWLTADTLKVDNWPTRGGEVPKEIYATAFFALMYETTAISTLSAISVSVT